MVALTPFPLVYKSIHLRKTEILEILYISQIFFGERPFSKYSRTAAVFYSTEYFFQVLDSFKPSKPPALYFLIQLSNVFLEMVYFRQIKCLLYCPLRYSETAWYLSSSVCLVVLLDIKNPPRVITESLLFPCSL